MTANVACCVDEPRVGDMVQRHGFSVVGWIYASDRNISSVLVSSGEHPIGETRLFFQRPDVNATLDIDRSIKTGFIVDCLVPSALRNQPGIAITVESVEWSGARTVVCERVLTFSLFDYRLSNHGYLFEDAFARIIPRDAVYATGPPAPEADAEVVDILTRYFDPQIKRILDVGCGIGAFGRAFRERGLPWIGCEVRADFVDIARADGLDSRLVKDERLPFEDGSFDAAFAIEVLEHIRDPQPFLREMTRVAPTAGYFSVPNFESIPITGAYYGLPWHMLEPDHWNFYGHGSLKALLQQYYREVEVFQYGALPKLRALDGLPVYNQLFAIGRNA